MASKPAGAAPATLLKDPPASAGDEGLIPGLTRSLGEGNGKRRSLAGDSP